MAIDALTAKRAAFAAVLKKIKDGKKLTAADYKLLTEMEAMEAQAKAVVAVASEPGEPNGGATLEEDLEEWTLRDGVVRGQVRKLSALAASHQIKRPEAEKILQRIQRGLLARYGFESAKKSGPLTGNEALALQWVKSIAQIARASQEWELQMQDAEMQRGRGKSVGLDVFGALVATLKQLAEKRDSLALKVRELSTREKKAGTARGQKANSFTIVMGGATDGKG